MVGANVAVAVGSDVEVGRAVEVAVAVAGGRAETVTGSEIGVAVGEGTCANTHPTESSPTPAETSDARFITAGIHPNTASKNYSISRTRQL